MGIQTLYVDNNYHKCGKGDISGSIPKIQSAQKRPDLQQRSGQLVTHKHHRQQQQPQQLQ